MVNFAVGIFFHPFAEECTSLFFPLGTDVPFHQVIGNIRISRKHRLCLFHRNDCFVELLDRGPELGRINQRSKRFVVIVLQFCHETVFYRQRQMIFFNPPGFLRISSFRLLGLRNFYKGIPEQITDIGGFYSFVNTGQVLHRLIFFPMSCKEFCPQYISAVNINFPEKFCGQRILPLLKRNRELCYCVRHIIVTQIRQPESAAR